MVGGKMRRSAANWLSLAVALDCAREDVDNPLRELASKPEALEAARQVRLLVPWALWLERYWSETESELKELDRLAEERRRAAERRARMASEIA
jgi:hypothetical protein